MHKKIKAFTLIELLVVIAIVGILSGFIFVSMNSAITASKDAKRKADLSAIAKAISMYSAQNGGALPSTGTSCDVCNGCGGACANLYTNIAPYLTSVPTDPNGATVYYKYTYSATLPSFTLQSTLSNGLVYQFDSATDGFSSIGYTSTCAAASVTNVVTCAPIFINSTEEACRCVYVGGNGTTTWTVPNGVTSVQYLVVAGGGGSADTGVYGSSGGGGGGGYRSSVSGESSGGGSVAESPLVVSNGDIIPITVGAGGAKETNGLNSIFSTIVSLGGGHSTYNHSGYNGGSGGGRGYDGSYVIGYGTAGQGYNGGIGYGSSGGPESSGGGGGAAHIGYNAAGSNTPGGAGGAGVASLITGASVTYAGGGGGSGRYGGGAGGAGGGGAGGAIGTAGSPNTGGGGGGSCNGAGAVGGSGVVIFRYTHP
jgi:prepilin-type N-terminal cleavage/methylation domain-containing protein